MIRFTIVITYIKTNIMNEKKESKFNLIFEQNQVLSSEGMHSIKGGVQDIPGCMNLNINCILCVDITIGKKQEAPSTL